MERLWEIAREVLVILIIPLLGWGISVEVRSAVAQERVSQMGGDISKMGVIIRDVRDNALHLVRLEGKIDTANARLEEIRRMLAKP